MKASDIIGRLEVRYGSKDWLAFTELREMPGFSNCRTIDFAAINKWPSKGHKFVCVEVKVTLADFRRELDDPQKRAPWVDMAHEFWFAAPKGVIPVEELPKCCGLLEPCGGKLRRTRSAASRHDAPGPSSNAWMMMVRQMEERRQVKCRQLEEFAEFAGKVVGVEDLKRLAEKYCAMKLWEIKQKIRDEIRTELREENKTAGQWAHVERFWSWKLWSLYGDSGPENAERAMKILDHAGALKRAAAKILEVIE